MLRKIQSLAVAATMTGQLDGSEETLIRSYNAIYDCAVSEGWIEKENPVVKPVNIGGSMSEIGCMAALFLGWMETGDED